MLEAAPQVQEVAAVAEGGEDLSGVGTHRGAEGETGLALGNVDTAVKKAIQEPIALTDLETEFRILISCD